MRSPYLLNFLLLNLLSTTSGGIGFFAAASPLDSRAATVRHKEYSQAYIPGHRNDAVPLPGKYSVASKHSSSSSSGTSNSRGGDQDKDVDVASERPFSLPPAPAPEAEETDDAKNEVAEEEDADSEAASNSTIICEQTQQSTFAIGLVETRFSCSSPSPPSSDDLTPSAPSKPTLHDYSCVLLPPYTRHPYTRRYTTLFTSLFNLGNQTCLHAGEAVEYAETEEDWRGVWRLTIYNTSPKNDERENMDGEEGGDEETKGKPVCEWASEIANIGEALYNVCVVAGLGGPRWGGREIEGVGSAWSFVDEEREEEKGKSVWRWCLRFSERGWGERVWQERCFGARVRVKDVVN